MRTQLLLRITRLGVQTEDRLREHADFCCLRRFTGNTEPKRTWITEADRVQRVCLCACVPNRMSWFRRDSHQCFRLHTELLHGPSSFTENDCMDPVPSQRTTAWARFLHREQFHGPGSFTESYCMGPVPSQRTNYRKQ